MSENTAKDISEDVDFDQVKDEAQPDKKGNTGLVALIVLLVLILGGGAVYWLYDKQQAIQLRADDQIKQYDSKMDELASQVKEGTSKIEEISTSQQSASTEINSNIQELVGKQTVLADTLETVQNAKPKQETDWIIAEVEYLLTVAQQRLSLERDVPTALAAMQGADNRLRDLGNPNLNGVREQLIKEMNALREVEDADISGMVLYLADATSRVESLPLKNFEIPTMNELKIPTKEEALAGNWKDLTLSMWGDLVKLVEIKDQQVPDEILFDPELRYFLHQNLQLELTSAKLSVLRRDSGSMQASLTRVSDILKRYFDVEAAPVKSMLEQVSSMGKNDLKPAMPEVTQALNLLKEYKKAASQEEQSS
ncbi:MAG: uroporphyrinogen-III C-methyltransferase [Gammaproteobacteria bacterium]